MTNALDIDGASIGSGDTVIHIGLPPFLTDDLPDEDVRAIKGQMGRTHKVVGFNEIDRIELEFSDDNGSLRTI